jgi:hypothetical protein
MVFKHSDTVSQKGKLKTQYCVLHGAFYGMMVDMGKNTMTAGSVQRRISTGFYFGSRK